MKLLLEYEQQNNIKYDNIILTRPDLIFYSEIDISKYDLNCLNIPQYGGNVNHEKKEINYVCHYKNVPRLEFIPSATIPFTDILIISKAENMRKLSSLYDNLIAYNEYGLPLCHPESIMYYHLGFTQNLQVSTHDIKYEVLRNNYREKENGIFLKFPVPPESNKYKIKLQKDVENIRKGFKSLLGIGLNFIKYKIKKKK